MRAAQVEERTSKTTMKVVVVELGLVMVKILFNPSKALMV